MKIYSIIPARGGSKGVPKKNIKLLNGYPLIAYSIRASLLCSEIDRTIVSTDSEEIAKIAKDWGAEVPFMRPAEISNDRSTDLELMEHAIKWFNDMEKGAPDLWVHLRPTTPFRNTVHIVSAIEAIIQDDNATSLRSLHEMSQTSYKTFEIEGEYLKIVYTGSSDIDAANRPRQDYPKTYDANGYVDIIKTSYVKEKHKIHGDSVIGYITPQSYEVDTHEDFEYLKYVASKNPLLIEKLFKNKDEIL